MRIWVSTLLLGALLATGACSRQDNDMDAREAGREARKASDRAQEKAREAGAELKKESREAVDKTKQAAKDADRKITRAGKEFKEGWHEGDSKSNPQR